MENVNLEANQDAVFKTIVADERLAEMHRVLTSASVGETEAAIELGKAFAELKRTNVSTQQGAVSLALKSQQLTFELQRMSPAMQAIVGQIAAFNASLAPTLGPGKKPLLDVGYSPMAEAALSASFNSRANTPNVNLPGYGGVGFANGRTISPPKASKPGGKYYCDASMLVTPQGTHFFDPMDNIRLTASKSGRGGGDTYIFVEGSVITERELSALVSKDILSELKNKVSIGMV